MWVIRVIRVIRVTRNIRVMRVRGYCEGCECNGGYGIMSVSGAMVVWWWCNSGVMVF